MIHDNRRRFARIYLDSKVKVVFRETEQRNQLLLANISEGGLFLASEQLKPIGSKLHFEFRVQDGGDTISGYGIVRWIESDPEKRKGMGIQFVEINPEGQKIIAELFKKKGLQTIL
jgi:c-di-GMP-binding flagellar brake protein YcgR